MIFFNVWELCNRCVHSVAEELLTYVLLKLQFFIGEMLVMHSE